MTEKLKNLSLYLPLCEVKPPRKNMPIIIQPIAPLPHIPDLPKQILQKIGVTKTNQPKKDSFLESFFPNCSTCTCNALSKQTLNQIGRQPDLQKQKQKHLKDEVKKNRFKQLYKLEKNIDLTDQENKKIFEQMYENFGHGKEQQWIKMIKNNKKHK